MNKTILILSLLLLNVHLFADTNKTITLTKGYMASNNSVGNEWSYSVQLSCQGEVYRLRRNSALSLSVPEGGNITFKAKVVEDEKYPDVGYSEKTVQIYDETAQEFDMDVTVREDRGRYAGNTAHWIFHISIQ